MRRILILALFSFFAGCSSALTPDYPKIEALSPEAALIALETHERDLSEIEQSWEQDTTNSLPGPPLTGQFAQAGQIVETLGATAKLAQLEGVREGRIRIAADRERIYADNPQLRPPPSPVEVTNAQCRFDSSIVTDANRRSLHAEARNNPNYTAEYQTVAQLVAELRGNGGASCSDITRQIDATMVSHRQAVTASDKFVAGSPWGVTCDNPGGSSSKNAACTAVATLYLAHSVSAICHEMCGTGVGTDDLRNASLRSDEKDEVEAEEPNDAKEEELSSAEPESVEGPPEAEGDNLLDAGSPEEDGDDYDDLIGEINAL